MNLEDFTKSLTGLVEDSEKNAYPPSMKRRINDKSRMITKMGIIEHGQPFNDIKKNNNNNIYNTLMAVVEHGRPFDTQNINSIIRDNLESIREGLSGLEFTN
jgi:hypothetical protein